MALPPPGFVLDESPPPGFVLDSEPKKPSRTTGEAFKDIGAGLVSGLGKAAQFPGQVYGLVSGEMPEETGLYGLAKRIEKAGEEAKSAGLKAQQEELNKKLAGASGILEEAGIAGKEILTNPALLANLIAETAPQMIGPAGLAKAGVKGAVMLGAKGTAKEVAELGAEKAAQAAAQRVGTRAAIGTGAAQQGADIGAETYSDTYKALVEKGVPEDEAKRQAINLARSSGASAAVISLLAQRLPGARRLEEAFAGVPGVGGRALGAAKTGLGESISEGFEEAGGKLAQNIAMQQISPEQELLKGVGAAGAMGALPGGVIGAGVGALQTPGLKGPVEEKKEEKQDEVPKKEPTKEQAMLQLGYTPKVENVEKKDPLRNPVGNFTQDELGKDLVQYVNKFRQTEGRPKLSTFSLEDLVDAGAPQQDIDRLLSFKNRFDESIKLSADDVKNIAQQRNVDTDTIGFKHFLTRATGTEDVDAMSQPQLHSAFLALSKLKPSEELRVLPEGTNATRFTEAQYANALKGINLALADSPSLGRTSVIKEIQDFTGLENSSDAEAILKTALDNGDLESIRTPHFALVNENGRVAFVVDSRESAERSVAKAEKKGRKLTIKDGAAIDITLPGEVVELPGGPDVRRGEFKQGEAPEGYEVRVGGDVLATVDNEEEAHDKAERYGATRQKDAVALQKQIDALNKQIESQRAALDQMEARGQGNSLAFQQRSAQVNADNQAAKAQIAQLEQTKGQFLRPLTVKATKGVQSITKEGFTYFEDNKPVATFDTREKADAFALSRLDEDKLGAVAVLGPTLKGLRAKSLGQLAKRELESRGRKGIAVEYKVKEGETAEQAKERVKANLTARGILSAQEQKARAEESKASKEMIEKADKIIADLRPMLNRFGLEKVGISVVESIRNGTADGFYAKQLVRIALDSQDPVGTMRHEAIHALKEMGAFTPEQWKVLEARAKKEWIQKFIVDRGLYEEYQKVYRAQNKTLDGFDEYIAEEAIADAFKFYKKPQPGLLGNIIYRMRQFFETVKTACNKDGIKTSHQEFEAIEAGKTKPTQEGGGSKYSLIRPAVPGEIEIATQNPQGKSRKYDPYTQMLSIDEKAILEAMESNPDLRQKIIEAIKNYAFIRKDTPDEQVIEDFKLAIVDNLLFLYNSVPAEIRKRSKLWYKGANRLAVDMAKEYNISMPQVAGIMAAMSPQKDWFQNVSMAERAIDILSKQGNKAWDANMLKYAESYVKEAEDIKDREARTINFEKMKATANAGTLLKNMNEEEAAFFIRSFDEAYNSRDYRLVTPEGGFGDFVRNKDGKLATMMWSTYIPLEKTVSIFRDGSRNNISDQLGDEHKIRSFYNNIASPDSDIGHVTIDTHAVAAGLFESLAGTDIEVKHNFGAIGGSDPIGVSGTYGIIADAYREAAKIAGVKPREMQSITWEAVRGIFDEDIKSSLKAPAKAEWNKYRNGEISFEQARANILEIAKEKLKNTKKQEWFKPDWFDSDRGGYVSEGVSSYDKDFVPAGGVRLRTEVPVKYKVSIQLSAATESIPGIKQLYAEAMSGNDNSYSVLQKVAESRLNFLIGGTDAKIKTNYVKGVYKSDREPAILATVTFREFDKTAVLAGLAQFAKNFNQHQIHVRQPTAYEFNHNFDDGSYATAVYEVNLKEDLTGQQIREIVEQIGLDGFTISPAVKDEPAKLTTYWVRDLTENESEQRAGFERFVAKVEEAKRLVGRGTEKSRRTIERLYVFGDGGIGYDTISGDLRTKKEADEVTPKIVAEHFKQESVKTFKQKDLTASQVKEQKLLAGVFERLPINDLNNPIVRKAYEEAAKDLVAQYNALPIKAEVMADVEIDGKIYSYWGLPNRELNRNGVEDLKKVLMSEMSAQDADAAIKYLRKSFGKPNPKWTGILKRVKAIDVDPYKNNSDAVRKDASLNNRLLVYKTSPRTFGPKGVDFKGHPLLEDSGVKDIHGYPMLYNDVLRVVHDYFAHNLSSTSFGPKGEFAAQRNHMATTNNPWSRWAIIAETRAQNAWQNFRPGVEGLSPRDRGFALQKAALPPIQFALTGDNQVDAPVLDLMKKLTFEQQMGSLDPSSPLAIQVKKLTPVEKPVQKTEEKPVSQETEEGKYSLRTVFDPAITARMDATTAPRESKGFVQRILDAVSPESRAKIRSGLIHGLEGFERSAKRRAAKMGNQELLADVSSIAAASQSLRAAAVTSESFRRGVPVYTKGYTTIDDSVKGLMDALAPLAKAKDPEIFRYFQFYAASKRGARLDSEGREQLFEQADLALAAQLAAQAKSIGIDFDSVYKDYQRYNEGIVKFSRDTGVLSAEQANYFMKFGDYIPFYRQMEGQETIGPKLFSSFSNVAVPKKLKGGEAKIGDFMENAVRNARSAIEAGMKNIAAQRGVRDALDEGLAKQVSGFQQRTPDIVSVREDGKTVYYQLADPLLVEAFKGLNIQKHPWVSIAAKPADWLRNLVTKDPGFMLANIMRDSVSSWVTSGSSMIPVVDSFKQMGKILAGNNPTAAAMAKAGLGGYEFTGDLKSSAKDLEKGLRKKAGARTTTEKALLPVTAAWDLLEKGSNASDMATRAEVYERVLKETGNEAEAFYQACEVLNFSRKGNWPVIQVFTALVPFMNARIQGLDILYRSGFGQMATANKEKMQKAFIVRSLSILALSAAYWALVHDDDEYKKLTEEERDNYWIIPGTNVNGKPLRFPIPFELGFLFKVVPERIAETMWGEDTGKQFAESIQRNLIATLKVNPIPQAITPLVENAYNISLFTGEPIVGRGLEKVEPKYQATSSTSSLALMIGDQFDVSPLKVDNLIRGYTGTMGMYAATMLDGVFSGQGDPVRATKRFEQLPVVKRFVSTDSGTVAAFFDFKDEVDSTVRTFNFLEKNDPEELVKRLDAGDLSLYGLRSYINSIDKEMTKVREVRTAVNASKDMTPDEKRVMLDSLHEVELALTADVKAIRKQYH